MIKGLLIGFGFLIVMTLIAVGIVRYANALGESRRQPGSEPSDEMGIDPKTSTTPPKR
ncbi:hypothetical protein P8631_11005 [Guyparkeria sp. 1SP6A2]|nr:hypothetical protein [Guyparkeria sp. 1SP6A2]